MRSRRTRPTESGRRWGACALAALATIAFALQAAAQEAPALNEAAPSMLVVPDMRDKDQLREFNSSRFRTCGRASLVARRAIISGEQPDSFLAQHPQPGTPVRCDQRVTIDYAGSAAREGGPGDTRVGDLSTEDGIARLESPTMGCDGEFSVDRRKRASTAPAGQFDGQDPSPDTLFDCHLTVIVWTSTGPEATPTPAAEPTALPTPMAWTMPDLAAVGGVEVLQADAQQRCGRPLEVVEQTTDRPPANGLLDQDPQPGAPIECGTVVRVMRFVPPATPAWLVVLAVIGGVALASAIGFGAVQLARRLLAPPVYAIIAGARSHVTAPPPHGFVPDLPDITVTIDAGPPAIGVVDGPLQLLDEEIVDD